MMLETEGALVAREWITRGAMLVAALVQCVPIVGVAGRSSLERLYGIAVVDPSTELLLRHRAVLLALVGVVIATGALRPAHRSLALVIGLASKLAFLWLFARAEAPAPPLLARVARADVVTTVLLVLAALIRGR